MALKHIITQGQLPVILNALQELMLILPRKSAKYVWDAQNVLEMLLPAQHVKLDNTFMLLIISV